MIPVGTRVRSKTSGLGTVVEAPANPGWDPTGKEVWAIYDDHGPKPLWAREYEIEILTPEDEAKTLLEAAGYTVTPPPEPQKGQIVVQEFRNGHIIYTDEPISGYRVIALVDWVEGQGINNIKTEN